jgi:hypothetical protein
MEGKKVTMTKKKTQKKTANITVKDCNFAGVTYDAKACEAIQVVAEGLRANAQGLATLAQVFTAQKVQIDCLLKL